MDELFSQCWKALPPVRKRIVGKQGTRRLFIDTLREWNSEALSQCKDECEIAKYEKDLLSKVERRAADGFAIVSFVLLVVAGAIISWLVNRWLDRRFPRDEFEALRAGV